MSNSSRLVSIEQVWLTLSILTGNWGDHVCGTYPLSVSFSSMNVDRNSHKMFSLSEGRYLLWVTNLVTPGPPTHPPIKKEDRMYTILDILIHFLILQMHRKWRWIVILLIVYSCNCTQIAQASTGTRVYLRRDAHGCTHAVKHIPIHAPSRTRANNFRHALLSNEQHRTTYARVCFRSCVPISHQKEAPTATTWVWRALTNGAAGILFTCFVRAETLVYTVGNWGHWIGW